MTINAFPVYEEDFLMGPRSVKNLTTSSLRKFPPWKFEFNKITIFLDRIVLEHSLSLILP